MCSLLGQKKDSLRFNYVVSAQQLHKFARHKVNWDSSVKICVPVYRNTAAGIMSSLTRYTLTVSHILCRNSLPALHQLAPLSLLHRWGYCSSYTANAKDWTLNIQAMRSHSCRRHAVCHGSHNLSWVLYSCLWLRKARAHQRENLWFEPSPRVWPVKWFCSISKQTDRFH